MIYHRTYRSLNKPLTVWGVERGLFFMALILGAATFNLFGSLLGGLTMFIALYAVAKWITGIDPQLPRIILNSARFRAAYDSAKFKGGPR